MVLVAKVTSLPISPTSITVCVPQAPGLRLWDVAAGSLDEVRGCTQPVSGELRGPNKWSPPGTRCEEAAANLILPFPRVLAPAVLAR